MNNGRWMLRKACMVVVAVFGLGVENITPQAVAGISDALSILPMPPPPREQRYYVQLQTGLTTGQSEWQVSFIQPIDGGGSVPGRSRLEWDDLDSLMYALQAGYRINSQIRIGAALGLGRIRGGHNTDTDWFTFGGEEFLFYQSDADTRGDVMSFKLDGYLRLNEVFPRRTLYGDWDLVFGFHYHEEELNDRNGVMRVDFGEAVQQPFGGLDSTFDFEWRAFRLGLQTELPLTGRFYARAHAVGLLGVDYRGQGFWNLRDDIRNASPNFIQRSDSGYGADLGLSFLYDMPNAFYMEMGYSWLMLRARSGYDRIYFADGDEVDTRLDWARTERHGFFVGVGATF